MVDRHQACERCNATFFGSQNTKHCSAQCYLLSRSKPHPNGCRLWTNRPGAHGYGVAKFCAERYSAHRLSYMTFVGPIPDGMDVLHSCDVRNCINPDHFFLGTDLDNVRDCIQKGRRALNNKLTEDDVRAIRRATGVPQRALARHYGVDIALIVKIKKWRIWKSVAP